MLGNYLKQSKELKQSKDPTTLCFASVFYSALYAATAATQWPFFWSLFLANIAERKRKPWITCVNSRTAGKYPNKSEDLQVLRAS